MPDNAAAAGPLLSGGIVIISDFADRRGGVPVQMSRVEAAEAWQDGRRGVAPGITAAERSDVRVEGGYLERLPLAAVRAGLADFAEVWHHQHGEQAPFYQQDERGVVRRGFWSDTPAPPYRSNDMLGFIDAFGAPAVLCVWGLGVSADILAACRNSTIIYNSLDVPPLRVPDDLVGAFDLVLTGAGWQSDDIAVRHPGLATEILPVGPEFASPETFFPIDCEKRYDIVYVAAAQPYKRHDLLLEALHRSPRPLKALCLFGYGEMDGALRARAQALDLDIDFVGPPGVSYPEVNRLINLARVGVVCGEDDGAPAILTEYMLAGLPVVANSRLKCGLQYIVSETGVIADADRFEFAILDVLGRLETFAPRQIVLERWSWPHSIDKLSRALSSIKRRNAHECADDGDAIRPHLAPVPVRRFP